MHQTNVSENKDAFNKWWIYQKERFPLVQHSPLIAVFSFGAVSFSAQLRGATPSFVAAVVAFIICLLTFLQLRIADEFKDFEEDRQYRPYRPVPRGLITLRQLGTLGAITAVIQALSVFWHHPHLLILLFITWTYLALMSVEFFAPAWLKARPITYLWTHMLIMPLVDLLATATDWLPNGYTPGPGLVIFLIASFFNGVMLEIGRKLRSADMEETGVQTYTRLWGTRKAPFIWLAAMAILGTSGTAAAFWIGFALPTALIYLVVLILATAAVLRFRKQPTAQNAKAFELLSGIATLALYGSLGILSLITN